MSYRKTFGAHSCTFVLAPCNAWAKNRSILNVHCSCTKCFTKTTFNQFATSALFKKILPALRIGAPFFVVSIRSFLLLRTRLEGTLISRKTLGESSNLCGSSPRRSRFAVTHFSRSTAFDYGKIFSYSIKFATNVDLP